MLKHFTYSVTFPSTGKEFGATVDFETGLTVITGSNEAGKSLILEMIRYSLFGKAALRGGAGDYKTLKTRLVFEAGKHDYEVIRTNTKQILAYYAGEKIAVGASVLNTKIPELLGFGLKVFDTSCSCNQGEIEALGNMKPTERKRMVDSVIGLTVLEDLEAWSKAEATSELRTVEALRLTLPAKPEAPAKPEFYEPSGFTKSVLVDLQKQISRSAEISGFLSSEPKKPESAPKRPDIEGTLDELREKYNRQVGLEKMMTSTKRKHDAIPDAAYTHEQLDTVTAQLAGYKLYQANQQEIKARGPKPDWMSEEIKAHEYHINAYHDWEIKRDLLAKGEHECPACNHKWPIADLGKYADVIEAVKPNFTLQDVRNQRQRHEAWATPLAELPMVETPALSLADINFHHAAIEKAAVKLEHKATILGYQDQLDDLKDADWQFQELDQWTSQTKAYEIENKAYLDWTVRADELKLELSTIVADQASYDATNRAFIEYHGYERDVEAHVTKQKEFKAALFVIGQHTATHESYTATAKGLKELRAKVKQFLVPSLNRVSSILLSQMTGGTRTKVEIDEEFEILIDGQPLNTLSGSAKAVANLAIRIGLGQVLTSKVFPIFLADEIDAAMDQERSNYTTDCLRGLSSVITQVILVTHKRPDADNYVEM